MGAHTKCDEAKPACSRCVHRRLHCVYDFHISAAYADSQASTQNEAGSSQQEDDNEDGSVSDSAWSFGQLDDSSGIFPDYSDFALLGSPPQGLLSPLLGYEDQDTQLLNHYHTHTSQITTFLPDELPVLQTDIPNLASTCGAVMHSLLALSAVCLACDLLPSLNDEAPALPSGRAAVITRVQELLAAGDSHHAASMQEIQQYLVPDSSGGSGGGAPSSSSSLNEVLANATLMAIYGSANHRAQVWLAQQVAARGASVAGGVVVLRFRWLFLFRAAHLAHRAFVGHRAQPVGSGSGSGSGGEVVGPSIFVAAAHAGSSPPAEEEEEAAHALLPVLCGTGPAAMSKLGEVVLAAQRSDGGVTAGLDACATAFRVLNTIISTLGSNLGSSPLRRIVMSFLNRAPQEYFDIIQMSHDQETLDGGARYLAMNILAHWLVLVMLLDGVWWIGDVGTWELRYVLDDVSGDVDGYWPASMYQIVEDMKRQTF